VSIIVRLKEQVLGVASCHGGKGAVHDLNGLKDSSGVIFMLSRAQEEIKNAAFARLLGWVPLY
jgi:hypothetical protein